MAESSSQPRVKVLHLLLALIVFQLMHVQTLWGHLSDAPTILGRYSPDYALILALWLGLSGLWIGLLFKRIPLQTLARRLPGWTLLLLTGAALLAIALLFASGLESQVQSFLTGNAAGLVAVLVLARPDSSLRWTRWRWAIVLLLLALLIPFAMSITVLRDFNPDEAQWVDRADSLYLVGGAYAHHLFYEPFLVEPGRGWIIHIYAWLLQTLGFDIAVGRMLNLAMFVVGLGGIGLVAAKFFDRASAFASVIIAAVGSRFFYAFDYREDHFVPIGQSLAFFAAASARQASQARSRYLWHGLCGLLATLSMEIHASALGFTIGISLFYLAEFLWLSYRQRGISAARVYTLVAFGMGALVGVAVFWTFNIAPTGLERYLGNLLNERGLPEREFRYLFTGTRLSLVAAWGGLAYLAWRRKAMDRLYLGLWLCSVVGITLIDTQGYAAPYVALMFAPAGVPLVQGLRLPNVRPGLNLHSTALQLSVILPLLIALLVFIDWSLVGHSLQSGQWPRNKVMDFGEQVLERVNPGADEIIIATHEMLWVMPDSLNLYSQIAEGIAEVQRGWTGTQVWEHLEPDIVVETPQRIVTPPGLQTYLDEQNFLVCDEFDAVGYFVRVYRRSCPSPTE